MQTQREGNTASVKTVKGAGLIRMYLIKDMQVLQNVE